MNIKNISCEDNKVVVSLSRDELCLICNVLYAVSEFLPEIYKKGGAHDYLYSEMIIARDICQYGHLDNFSISSVVKSRGIKEEQKDEL